MNHNAPVPTQNSPQRFEDLPIYLQATLGSGVQPFEYAEQRSGGGLVRYSSVKVYNGPYKSGNTQNNHGAGVGMVMLFAAGVLVLLIILGGGA